MEAAKRKKIAAKGGKTAKSGSYRPHRKDHRRLAQLIVSLLLFVAVFLGTKLNPAQGDEWNKLISADVDLILALQELGQSISEKQGIRTALKTFGLSMIGEELKAEPTSSLSPLPEKSLTPLMETEWFGLEKAREYGVTVSMPKPVEKTLPVPAPAPDTAPEPEVVTAVAQVYGMNGEALPSNVSLVRYELGLNKTVDPVKGDVTSGFGYRTSPITGKREFHLALDIAAEKGTPILAFADGKVRYIGESDEFGLYLMIDHANGVSTFYAHCSKLLVRKGEQVVCGQTVAQVGDTGNVTGAHLHLTVLKDNIRLDPSYYVDP